MRLIAFRIENFKGVRHVELAPGERGLVILGGANGAGKSSALDGLTWALGGKKHAPQEPVRRGADEAEVVLELSDPPEVLTVRRRVGTAGRETLTITAADGRKQHSPQAWLDRIVGQRFLDPLAFLAAPEKVQRDLLLRCLGVGDELDRLVAERADVFEERTAVNRSLRDAKGELAGMPADLPVTAPAVPDVSALRRQREQLAQQGIRRARVESDLGSARASLGRLEAEVQRLEEQLRIARGRVSEQEGCVRELEAGLQLLPAAVDTFDLDMEIAGAEEQQRARAAFERWDGVRSRASRVESESAALTSRLEAIDAAKAAAVAAAPIPVEGLGIGDTGVTWRGVPLTQASASEGLRVALGVAAALQPELRAIWLQGGERLDAAGLKLVEDFAHERDLLVLLERVGDSDAGAIVIEDGEVKRG